MRHLLLLIALLSPLSSAYAYDKQKLLDAFFSIVMVRGYNNDGGLAYGSGVIVAPNKVMTSCHIFRQTGQPWVSRGEDTYSIVSVQADRWHDVCLVTTDNLPFKAVELGKGHALQKGQEVIAIGHSSGIPTPAISHGSVKSLYELGEGSIIRSTARFALGASGSGLFDGEGRLVGINTFKTIGRVAYYYAMPVEWLDTLEKYPVETKFPIVGKAFWEEEDAAKPFFLQVAVPELQEDWPKLAEVAERWAQAEPKNSEAWYEIGLAQEHMGRQPEAEQAYRKAVSFNTTNTDALFRIGVIAFEKGDQNEVHAIRLALLNINKDLAEEFGKTVGCGDQC